MIWNPLIEVPARLTVAGPNIAYCPYHDDDSPSLSFTPGGNGAMLLHCHRDPPCVIGDIMAALGLKVRDLFPHNGPRPIVSASVIPVMGRSPSTHRIPISTSPKKSVPREISVEANEIRDENNWPVVVQLRIELDPPGKKFSYQRPGEKGTRRVRLKDLQLTPADLPLWGSELLRRHPDKPVVICEGIKSAKALRKADAAKVFITLAAIAGAGVLPSFQVLRCLTDRDVILWPDADGAGRKLMNEISFFAPARSIRFVRIPEVGNGYDAADFFAAGGTLKQTMDCVEEGI